MIDTHIQVVESNLNLRSLLSWNLQQSGYRVQQCADMVSAREGFQSHQPGLVVLEAEFAHGQGLQLCQWLQRQGHPLILMLSARTSEADVVAGLRAGADDYLKKPFGMQEFLARVESLARRSRHTTKPLAIDCGELHIDLVQRRVRYMGEFVDLTPQEFSLLYVLTQAEGEPLTRIDLLRRAWPDAIDNPRTVDTHVLSLRKKIEPDPRHPDLIQTVRNVGYRICVGEIDRAVNRPIDQPVEAMAIAAHSKPA
ncbi:MAG: response regulator transcription factor [Phormidesmis sp. RL_2_1]|nr:response regulator transcription factor [Phormidesmis sp. RL_2_1]